MGHDTHGLALLPRYLEEIAAGAMTIEGAAMSVNTAISPSRLDRGTGEFRLIREEPRLLTAGSDPIRPFVSPLATVVRYLSGGFRKAIEKI